MALPMDVCCAFPMSPQTYSGMGDNKTDYHFYYNVAFFPVSSDLDVVLKYAGEYDET